jgi:putative DNA primase/helicase
MIWEGDQDIGKSTGLKALTGTVGEDYFSDQTILDVREKEQQELTRGRWLFEIAELTGIRKAEVEKVKGFISRTHDRCRPAWGHFVVDQPRQCVFAGTTNDHEYLIDQTGNRRWWPVGWITSVDVGWIKANRDQLFAEAVVLERDEALFMPPDLIVEMRSLQESRRAKHAWEDVLTAEGYLNGKPKYAVKILDEWRVHSNTVLVNVLGLPPSNQRDGHTRDLLRCMTRLGWEKPKGVIRINGKVANGYIKKELAIEGPKQ